MHDHTIKDKFMELRAGVLSLKSMSSQIGVPRPTLSGWNHRRIKHIHELLEAIARDLECDGDKQFMHSFDALELPSILSSVIRHLQPLLLPIEAAVYWHMLERSVISTGQQYCRVSTRGLRNGVIKSTKSDGLAIQSTRGALKALEAKGAILQSGETNRDGTFYKVLLPEEIPACAQAMREASAPAAAPIPNEKEESDFYNVGENRLRVFERDEYKCRYCGKQLTRFTATLDHVQPVSEGGKNSFENLVTACLHCNSRRGARPVMEAIIEGQERLERFK